MRLPRNCGATIEEEKSWQDSCVVTVPVGKVKWNGKGNGKEYNMKVVMYIIIRTFLIKTYCTGYGTSSCSGFHRVAKQSRCYTSYSISHFRGYG